MFDSDKEGCAIYITVAVVCILILLAVHFIDTTNRPSVEGGPLPEMEMAEDGWQELGRWSLVAKPDGDWFFPVMGERKLYLCFVTKDGDVGTIMVNGRNTVKIVDSDDPPELVHLRNGGATKYEFRGPISCAE